jgi:hypothetical protein
MFLLLCSMIVPVSIVKSMNITRENNSKQEDGLRAIPRSKKISAICSALTTQEAWSFELSKERAHLAYRKLNKWRIAPKPHTPDDDIKERLESHIKKSLPRASKGFPVVLRDLNNVFVGSEDGALYILEEGNKPTSNIKCIPNCHNGAIESLCLISNKWLAMSGTLSITFLSVYEECKQQFIFKDACPISQIHEDSNILIVTRNDDTQFALYPYGETEYKIFHNVGRPENELDILLKLLLLKGLIGIKEKKLDIIMNQQEVDFCNRHLTQSTFKLISFLIKSAKDTQ